MEFSYSITDTEVKLYKEIIDILEDRIDELNCDLKRCSTVEMENRIEDLLYFNKNFLKSIYLKCYQGSSYIQ